MTEIRKDLENLSGAFQIQTRITNKTLLHQAYSHFQRDPSEVSKKTNRNTGEQLYLESDQAKGRSMGAFFDQVSEKQMSNQVTEAKIPLLPYRL